MRKIATTVALFLTSNALALDWAGAFPEKDKSTCDCAITGNCTCGSDCKCPSCRVGVTGPMDLPAELLAGYDRCDCPRGGYCICGPGQCHCPAPALTPRPVYYQPAYQPSFTPSFSFGGGGRRGGGGC